MNDLENSTVQPDVEDELNTTPPNPASSAIPSPPSQNKDGWTMPKPVFRQSSGQPANREDRAIEGSEDVTAIPNAPEFDPVNDSNGVNQFYEEPAGDSSMNAAAGGQVEPQPELSELLDPEPTIETAVPQVEPKRGAMRSVMLVFGVVVIVAFIALFLAVVYFLFLKAPVVDSAF